MIEELRASIKCRIENSQRPAVLSSFQRDSALLLHLIAPLNIPVIWFREKMNKCAERTIKQLDLTVISYPPVDQYLVPHEGGLTLVSEYSMGTMSLPTLQDLIPGDGELRINPKRMAHFDYPFDETLWGYRRCDRHPLVGVELDQEIVFGPTRLFAPLYDLTDEQVQECCDELEIACDEFVDDDIPCSPEVFAAIESMEWDRNAALSNFRLKYGLPH